MVQFTINVCTVLYDFGTLNLEDLLKKQFKLYLQLLSIYLFNDVNYDFVTVNLEDLFKKNNLNRI